MPKLCDRSRGFQTSRIHGISFPYWFEDGKSDCTSIVVWNERCLEVLENFREGGMQSKVVFIKSKGFKSAIRTLTAM